MQNVETKNLPPVDVIIATPSCKNASIANAAKGSGEQTDDIEVSKAISALIKEQLPRFFILENVQGYVNFESFQIIRNVLAECGYHSDFQLLNLKDFGIAQNRKRLYLMAALHQFFPPMMQVSEKIKGWYEAIVDLINSLPETNIDHRLKTSTRLEMIFNPELSCYAKRIPVGTEAIIVNLFQVV